MRATPATPPPKLAKNDTRERINILVTADVNYILPLRVMLKSLFLNNSDAVFRIYLVYSKIGRPQIEGLRAFCKRHGSSFVPVALDKDTFADAPVFMHYTKAMYYRLLAAQILPKQLERILYLDPDILVINELKSLYNLDMADCLYAAAAHKGFTNLAKHVHSARLGKREPVDYFNSGVLLMNLTLQRREVKSGNIFAYVKDRQNELLLPDQDVLNGLYGHRILALDDSVYNYDARHFNKYLLTGNGSRNMGWVMQNTAILHFCGKHKPWHNSYTGRFDGLYKHYMQLALKLHG